MSRARQRFFEHAWTIAAYLVFPSWAALIINPHPNQPPKSKNKWLAESNKQENLELPLFSLAFSKAKLGSNGWISKHVQSR
jgi:hypothetical protein